MELHLKAIKIDPDIAQAHFNLGVDYLHMRRVDQAAKSFQRAIQIDPEYGRAYSALAQIDRMRGDEAEARKKMQRAQQLLATNQRQQKSLSAMPWATGTPLEDEK